MKFRVNIDKGQDFFPDLVTAAEKGAIVTITKHKRAVAYLIGHKHLGAIGETIEIMGSEAAMDAIAWHKEGRTQFGQLKDLRR